MYNLVLKFKTPIHIKMFDKSFENVLKHLNGTVSIPYIEKDVENTMTITNSPVIPNKDWISDACSTIHTALKDSFASSDDVNVAIASDTVFCGFTSIEEF